MNTETRTAPSAGISFSDLLLYAESEAAKWRAWLEAQPSEVLDLPFGNPAQQMGSVRDMIRHLFLTEWVYSCVLNGEPFDAWDQFKYGSVAELFSIGDAARAGLRRYLATATEADMAAPKTLSAGGFSVSGSARKFLAHTFVHGLRHWAQIATVLRQHGHQTGWEHDLVLSDAIE